MVFGGILGSNQLQVEMVLNVIEFLLDFGFRGVEGSFVNIVVLVFTLEHMPIFVNLVPFPYPLVPLPVPFEVVPIPCQQPPEATSPVHLYLPFIDLLESGDSAFKMRDSFVYHPFILKGDMVDLAYPMGISLVPLPDIHPTGRHALSFEWKIRKFYHIWLFFVLVALADAVWIKFQRVLNFLNQFVIVFENGICGSQLEGFLIIARFHNAAQKHLRL